MIISFLKRQVMLCCCNSLAQFNQKILSDPLNSYIYLIYFKKDTQLLAKRIIKYIYICIPYYLQAARLKGSFTLLNILCLETIRHKKKIINEAVKIITAKCKKIRPLIGL